MYAIVFESDSCTWTKFKVRNKKKILINTEINTRVESIVDFPLEYC